MTKQITNTISNESGLQLLTIPTRVHGFLNEKMKLAVAQMNKDKKEGEREYTVADFIRIAAAEKVAAVLHEEVTELPPVIRGRGNSYVAQTAKRLGISQEEFARRAAELVAAHAFGYKGPADDLIGKLINGEIPVVNNPRPSSKSGTYPAMAPQAQQSHQDTGKRPQRRIVG